MNPYIPTESAMQELHSRISEKIKCHFPTSPPEEIVKRINREAMALESCPYTYALLIVDEVIKTLRRHRFSVFLDGDWLCSYYAWLLGLTKQDAYVLALYYKSIGFQMKELYRDRCHETPMEIELAPGWGKAACLELLRQRAREWGFWLWECPEGGWKLISLDHRPDDMYAACAPIISIVDGK